MEMEFTIEENTMPPPSSTVPSLAVSALSSATMPSRPQIQKRLPQRSLLYLSTTAITILSLLSATTVVHAHTQGLRGQWVELDVTTSGDLVVSQHSRMPQHGQQRPGRPANLPPHMLPPPGYEEHLEQHRRLFMMEEEEESSMFGHVYNHHHHPVVEGRENLTLSNGEKDDDNELMYQNRRVLPANEGATQNQRQGKKRLKQKKKHYNAPPQSQQALQELIEQRVKDREKKQKLRGENELRKEANKKLKEKMNNKRGDNANQKKNGRPSSNRPQKENSNNRPGRDDGDDKEGKDKNKKDKNKNKNKNDKDKDKNDKDKDKNNGKRPRPKNDTVKPQKDTPDKQQDDVKDDMKPQKFNTEAFYNKPPKDDKPTAAVGGAIAAADPTPKPTKRPKKKPNNIEGGGSFSSFVAQSASQPADPTPKPTKRPKKKTSKPTHDAVMTDGKLNLASLVLASSSVSNVNTPRPTPRPTRKPKPNSSGGGVGIQQELSSGFESKPFVIDESSPPPPTPRPTRTPRPTKSPTPRPTRTPRPTKLPTPRPIDTVQEDIQEFTTPAEKDDSENNDLCTNNNSKKWCFVPSLTDHSTPLDSFEETSNLDWRKSSVDPWGFDFTESYSGSTSIASGFDWGIYDDLSGLPSYSNLTLVTDNSFNGGILTFRIKSMSLMLPNEAFFVMVDDNVALSPDVTARILNTSEEEWVELNVPVGRGSHVVTWVHVYNPFGLQSLPDLEVDREDVGLWMDDLRYVPYDTNRNLDTMSLEMTTGGGGGSEEWSVSGSGDTVVASSSNLNDNGGNADIQFALHSPSGGVLEYTVRTSTTAPNDDFCILFNNDETPVEAMFGDMLGYKRQRIDVPAGKVVVTLRHRSNPGELRNALLVNLSGEEVGTDGKTWLQDLRFRAD